MPVSHYFSVQWPSHTSHTHTACWESKKLWQASTNNVPKDKHTIPHSFQTHRKSQLLMAPGLAVGFSLVSEGSPLFAPLRSHLRPHDHHIKLDNMGSPPFWQFFLFSLILNAFSGNTNFTFVTLLHAEKLWDILHMVFFYLP